MNLALPNALPHHVGMRRRWLIGMFALATMAVASPHIVRAAVVDDAVAELQHDWEVIRYQTPVAEREKRFEALAAKARKISRSPPGRAEPLVWEGIIVS